MRLPPEAGKIPQVHRGSQDPPSLRYDFKVLYSGRDKTSLDLVRQALSSRNIRIVQTTSAARAMNVVRMDSPDLVIVDGEISGIRTASISVVPSGPIPICLQSSFWF